MPWRCDVNGLVNKLSLTAQRSLDSFHTRSPAPDGQTKAIVPTARIIVGIRRGSRDDGGGPIPARLLRALQEIVQLLPRKDIRSVVAAIGDAPHHAAVR